jgi:hypothetical protein
MIDITKMQRNTVILIETVNAVYEIKVTGPKSCTIEIQGGKRFVRPTKAILNGSFEDSDAHEKELQKGMINWAESMDISYKINKITHSISTADVLSARIYAPDGSWNYEVWDDAHPDISGAVQEAKARNKR